MKQLGLLIITCATMFYSCAPDVQINKDSYSSLINPDVNKSFEKYSYKEYLPRFIAKIQNFDSVFLGNKIEVHTSLVNIPFPSNPNNPDISDEKANLGRILFYDKNLSASKEVSCGSCHHQSKAFTDGLEFSKGHRGELTDRSSMSIQNMAFVNNYFWDSRVQTLENLVKQPLVNRVEMGNSSMAEVVDRLKGLSYYNELFYNAFGSEGINEASVSKALLQFVQSIYSSNSKFDKGVDYNFQNFNLEEMYGLELFTSKAGCNHCHAMPTFAAPDFVGGTYGQNSTATMNQNIRTLPMTLALTQGRTNNGLITDIANDNFFKIPTLRNIALTGPYMHDGRLKTLADVIEYYDHEVIYNPSLDPALCSTENNQPIAKKLHLSVKEKSALLAFLKTLTDPELTTAARYSNPF